jgi:hypothetical protein
LTSILPEFKPLTIGNPVQFFFFVRHLTASLGACASLSGYKHLYAVVCMYLCTPVGTADIERSFSSAHFLIQDREQLGVVKFAKMCVIRDFLFDMEADHADDEAFESKVMEFVEAVLTPHTLLMIDADPTNATNPDVIAIDSD